MSGEKKILKKTRGVDAWMCGFFSTPLRIYTSALLLLFAFCFLPFTFPPAFASKMKEPTPRSEAKHRKKVLKKEAKERYQRSILPRSGYMTTEEYEFLSKDIPNSDKEVPPYKQPRDIKMKYVPQPTYSLIYYNNPPGSPELHIQRRFQFDRQMNCTGITSPNMDIMVYPVVYYYAVNQCTAGDLFVIPLDRKFSDVERISRANVVKRIPEPILSTTKDISEKFIFRSMTPIDFSPDGSKLIAKEKIGNSNDGIWKTNLWIYDFNTKQARALPEIREAIKFYWLKTTGLTLDEKRWDIYPLGFAADNPQRIVVTAYGYTGRTPKFLGTWSIGYNGEQPLLISLTSPNANISLSGLKLVQSGIVNPSKVHSDEKKENKIAKQNRNKEKQARRKDISEKKKILREELKEIRRSK